MLRSKRALKITAFYIVCVLLAIIANQRGTDPEAVILGQVVLAFPWIFALARLGANTWYGLYIYALCIALNAATLYLIVAWATARKKSR